MDHPNTYRDKMDQVQPPGYLKKRVTAEMHTLLNKKTTLESSELASSVKKPQSTTKKNIPKHRKRLVFLSAAAALLIVAISIPLIVVTSEDNLLSHTNGSSSNSNSSFMLTAYAATPETQYSEFEGLVSFGYAGGGAVEDSEDGKYATWLFNVEGEGIAQVDLECSIGQIYCFATQRYSNLYTNPIRESDDPESEAVREALREKLGGDFLLSSYGWSISSDEDGDGSISGDISGSRLLGASPSIETALAGGNFDLGEVSFGFYIANEDLAEGSNLEEDFFRQPSALMASLDGQTLNIQVHFLDGSTASQTYILRVKKMKVVLPLAITDDGSGRNTYVPYEPEEASEGGRFGYVLFGELVLENGLPVATDSGSSPNEQQDEAMQHQSTAEFLVVDYVKSMGQYTLKLDDLQHNDLMQQFGYTHTTWFPAPESSDFNLADDVEVIDSEGNRVDLDPVTLCDKRVRITFYDAYESDVSGPFPILIRGVSKIEILDDASSFP